MMAFDRDGETDRQRSVKVKDLHWSYCLALCYRARPPVVLSCSLLRFSRLFPSSGIYIERVSIHKPGEQNQEQKCRFQSSGDGEGTNRQNTRV